MFVLSKLLWLFLDPLNLLMLLVLFSIGAAWKQRWTWVRRASFGVGALLLLGVLPVGKMMCAALEDRIPPARMPDRVDGIVVLGGGINPWLSQQRGQTALNDAAERITAFATLARRYPDAKLLVTGGNGMLTEQPPETVATRALLVELGVDPTRLILEDASRNTYENAVNSVVLVHPVPTENWLLITSAAHMPRALAVFRRQNWNVLPYPVDYRTDANAMSLNLQPLAGLGQLSEAIHEWTGLIAYRLLDRTDALWPAP